MAARFFNEKFFTMIFILSLGVSLNGCSKTGNIKDWLKEGTKEYQKENKSYKS